MRLIGLILGELLCSVLLLPCLARAEKKQEEKENPEWNSAWGTFKVTMDIIDGTVSWASKTIGFSESCSYVDDPVTSLSDHLPQQIRGQSPGLQMILDAFSSWEFGRKAGLQQPLVLAVTGPTGVGKSETSFIIAQAILSSQKRIGVSRRHVPEGYLVLGGQDYSNTSDAFLASSNGLAEVHRRINLQITDHLRRCGGSGVIVFDEIQKVVPGALDILVGGLKERGSFRVYGSSGVESFSTENVVFILTSDIGAEDMEDLLIAYDDRELIPQQILRSEVKKTLDKQWDRLHFGSVVSEVVPFLPLEEKQIQQIMTLKLQLMSLEYRNLYWLDLCVESSVIQALSRPPFIQYRSRKIKMKVTNGTSIEREKTMALYGARGIENGGPIQDLKTKMYKHMKPWKKGSVLHISTRKFDVSSKHKQDPEIVMRWCMLDISMSPPPDTQRGSSQSGLGLRVGHYLIQKKHIKSPLCEEKWSGTLSKS